MNKHVDWRRDQHEAENDKMQTNENDWVVRRYL